MNIYEKLIEIQNELKAPKGQYNSFGKYNYRSCEDILEALKPICKERKALVFISDKVVHVEGRQYIEATVTFVDVEKGDKIESTAFAREEESKKGMDGSQVTGASSSYARKYALNGMFCIDDTKDSDSTNQGESGGDSGLTEAQIKRLYAIAKSVDITPNQVIKVIKADYDKADPKKLTKAEYEAICNRLEGKKKED